MHPAALRPSVQSAHAAFAWHSLICPSVAALPASPRLLNQFTSLHDIETWRVLRSPSRFTVWPRLNRRNYHAHSTTFRVHFCSLSCLADGRDSNGRRGKRTVQRIPERKVSVQHKPKLYHVQCSSSPRLHRCCVTRARSDGSRLLHWCHYLRWQRSRHADRSRHLPFRSPSRPLQFSG